ncbi:tetratricopeptide repeat protein [Streptomyces sp. NBC_00178]|uniref:tetratricopeptide repeat protein n=1 Tax=Streptomyces sp. NBC_00178 TaxID=2975672 RepID=UPI002E2E0A4B|nr:tetratricopeptide repeat protein [Streptomyces sp. NBC_00178]
MAGRRPTRQEVNRRGGRAGFVGRRGELAVFRETFARDPEDADFPFLFHVRGNGGVGKSTLVRQWETAAREQPSVVTSYVDDEVHDAIEAMEAVSARLGRQGHPLKRFDRQLATYRQRRHQAESAAPGLQPLPGAPETGGIAPPSPSSTVAAQLGLATIGLVPGAGPFVGAVDPQQVALGADRLRAMLNTRLRSHDDVHLVMHPLAALAPVFLDDLAEVAERCERVVLFFDVYERTGPVLDAWLRTIAFGEEYGSLPVNVQIVLSGQLRLDQRVWGEWLGQVTEVCLEVFSEEEARTLLATHGVTDGASVELVLRLSGRLPLLVDMLARSDGRAGDGFGDPSETAVERFLKWEPDPGRREAALACALPLLVDEDIYSAVVPGAAADGYAWLRALAFVSPQAGRCRYHDVVRAAMLRLQRTRSPERWQRAHTRLAELFERGRLGAEAELGGDADAWWGDAVWREHRLNETYHRLCAHPRGALPGALLQTVHAVGLDVATHRRWAQTLGRAGVDADSAALMAWGGRLESAADEEESGAGALTLLLAAPELGPAGRALAYSVRGREHRVAGDHERALADCTAAVALAPDTALCHAGLGETYRALGRHEEAVAACTRAIELDPGDAWTAGSRGEAYRLLGRYDEALADFSRAVTLDPLYAWAFGSRAQTYEALGRKDDALADYDRALGIDPDYEWAVGSRAQLLEAMGRPEEALADYTLAIAIDPQYAWAVGSRARLFGRMGRHEEALADFSRAVEIDPLYAWAFGSRAQTYEAVGRYEEAVTDYGRALAIDPGFGWALTGRGELHERMGRHEDAVADYGRALGAGPPSDWTFAARGRALLSLGRHEEALADCARAVELDPDDAWNELTYALALLVGGGGRHEEATARLDRAGRGFAAAVESAAGAGEDAADAYEGLLVLHCVLLDGDGAAVQCEALAGLERTEGAVRETLDALAFVRRVLPAAGPAVERAERRLRGADGPH